MSRHYLILLLMCFLALGLQSQEITQFEVFSGRYDYTAFGNTMNLTENESNAPCEILTTSTATLSLQTTQTVVAAYLYWAGSGTGDFEVTLNGTTLVAERTFEDQIDDDRPFFAAFVDITEIIQGLGAIDYTLSNLDITDVIPAYCATGTNFAGWAVTVIYEDPVLPLNQINVFDGLESVSSTQNELNITLQNLNVLDNNNAKIGFVAWEGDTALATNETLSINGNILINPPLNPASNQFNGTNSFTGANDLYNMDIDVYGIENNIDVGDTQATIQLTSGQDFVMINSIITVLNSQLPDGVVSIDDIDTSCNSRDVTVNYTITNQGTDLLPAETPISFYADGIFTGSALTSQPLAPEEFTEQVTVLTITDAATDTFGLVITVDDDGSGNGIVIEANENNNESAAQEVQLVTFDIAEIEILFACDLDGDGLATFDLVSIAQTAGEGQQPFTVEIYLNEVDAMAQENVVSGENFMNTTNPQDIFFRFESGIDASCVVLRQTTLQVVNPPVFPVIADLTVCDDASNDGLGIFDLTSQNQVIINGQAELSVSFFTSQNNADGNINAIENPENFENSFNPQEIFIRLQNINTTACAVVATVILEVTPINETVVLPALVACNEGFEMATFDLSEAEDSLQLQTGQEVSGYYSDVEDAFNEENSITDPFAYMSLSNPQTIFIRTDDTLDINCYELSQFDIRLENCPPFVPEGFSPSGDDINDIFEISGLKDIFTQYQLRIYTRLGNLVYEGDNDVPFWDGRPNVGLGGIENPTGVYYWVLYLNDSDVKDMTGWVYLNR